MPYYTPYFDELVGQVGVIPALVFGLVWRYCRMEEHVCRASLTTLAGRLGMSRATVTRALRLLVATGWVEDLTPGWRNRPHHLRPTHRALRALACAVAESNSGPVVSRPAVAQSDSHCSSLQQRAVADCNMNQTLLREKRRDEEPDTKKREYYASKVEHANRQVGASHHAQPVRLCRFASFDGRTFVIAHPDREYTAILNRSYRRIYHSHLALWIAGGFEVVFIARGPP